MTTRKHVSYGILALISLLGLGITQSARANIIATINQVDNTVVGTGSGTIDLVGLIFLETNIIRPGVNPSIAAFNVGSGNTDIYSGVSGPTNFGIGGPNFQQANSSTGNPVSVFGAGGHLRLPQGYLTGNPLFGTFTFNHATLASLGIAPGTYTWTWGTGMHADSFTLQIADVPDAGSTLPLLGFASLGLVALRRKLRC